MPVLSSRILFLGVASLNGFDYHVALAQYGLVYFG
jgi:hypothetical protein